jgi:hypothetical protein
VAPLQDLQPSPEAQEAAATAALRDSLARIEVLAARLAEIESEQIMRAAHLRQTEDEATAARTAAAALPAQVTAAKARLLVSAYSSTSGPAKQAVKDAEQDLADAERAVVEAEEHLADTRSSVKERRTQLEAQRAEIEAERGALTDLIADLERQVAEARAAHGQEILSAGIEAVEALLAAQDEARTRLAEREAAVLACRVRTADLLTDYLAQRAQIAGTALEIPEQPGAEVRIVETYLSHLDALETGFGHIGHQAAGGVPLWAIITSGTGLPGVLAGLNPSYVPGKRAAARTWLEALAEGRA